MASRSWGTTRSVADSLIQEGERFSFYQAVRLLEFMHPERISLGESADADREAVRFRSAMTPFFPASEVVEVTSNEHDPVPTSMTVAFLGLAG